MATPPTKSDKDLAAQRNELTSRPLAAIRMSATLVWRAVGVRSTLPGKGSATLESLPFAGECLIDEARELLNRVSGVAV